MTIYSTINFLIAEGAKDGKLRGLKDGACKQLCKLLMRLGKRQFGEPSDEQRAILVALADRLDQAQLENLQGLFVRVASWPALLAETAPAAEPPGQPDYLQPYEFSPTPMPPSLDQYVKVTLKVGTKAVMHLRFQRIYQKDLGAVLSKESERLQAKYGCPVHSVVLLLWPGADGPGVTGEWRSPSGKIFRYQVARIWEKDVEEMFTSPFTAAMSPLAKFDPTRLQEIVRRMEVAIGTEPDADVRGHLWTVAYQSMGLRYPAEKVNHLLAHVLPLLYQQVDSKAALSTGYYEGFSEGQSEGAVVATRNWVLGVGSQRLSEPEPSVAKALHAIASLERLEQLAGRVCKGETWQEVLAMN